MSTPLRLARRKAGQTIQAVAAAVGTDVGNLSRIERGLQVASRDLAERLALHFKKQKLTELQIIYPERYEVA